jgi:hypothetical protein
MDRGVGFLCSQLHFTRSLDRLIRPASCVNIYIYISRSSPAWPYCVATSKSSQPIRNWPLSPKSTKHQSNPIQSHLFFSFLFFLRSFPPLPFTKEPPACSTRHVHVPLHPMMPPPPPPPPPPPKGQPPTPSACRHRRRIRWRRMSRTVFVAFRSRDR